MACIKPKHWAFFNTVLVEWVLTFSADLVVSRSTYTHMLSGAIRYTAIQLMTENKQEHHMIYTMYCHMLITVIMYVLAMLYNLLVIIVFC